MTTLAPHPAGSTVARPDAPPPLLLLFGEHTSGQTRRMDGYVAHVLQRRHNHTSFRYRMVLREEHADLFDRFHVGDEPTIVVIDEGRVQARLVGYHTPHAVEELLHPWLH